MPVGSGSITKLDQISRHTEQLILLLELKDADSLFARFGSESADLWKFLSSQSSLTLVSSEQLSPSYWGDGMGQTPVDFCFEIGTGIRSGPLSSRFSSWESVGNIQTLYIVRSSSSIAHILRHGFKPYPEQAVLLTCGRGLVFFTSAQDAIDYYMRRSKVTKLKEHYVFACRVALGKSFRSETLDHLFPQAPKGFHSLEIFGGEAVHYIVFDKSQILPSAFARVLK